MSRMLKFYWRLFAVLDTPMIAVRGTAELAIGALLLLYPKSGNKGLIYLPCVLLGLLVWDMAMGFFDDDARNNNWRMFGVGFGIAGFIALIVYPVEVCFVAAAYMALAGAGYLKAVISGSEDFLGRGLCLLQGGILGYLSWIIFTTSVIRYPEDLFGALFLSLGAFDWAISPFFAKLDR